MSPFTMPFFITGFLICHSFLDFLYMGFSSHSGKLFVRSEKYPLPLLTCDTVCFCGELYLALFEKEIEIDFGHKR